MMLSRRAGKVESMPTDAGGAETRAVTVGRRGGGGGSGSGAAAAGSGCMTIGCLAQPAAATVRSRAQTVREGFDRAKRKNERAMFNHTAPHIARGSSGKLREEWPRSCGIVRRATVRSEATRERTQA